MGMVVKNNISALNALNTMNRNNSALSKSLEKVSSGMKINSATIKDGSYKAINGKLISDSSSFGKKIPVTHKAKTFMLMAADNNIIRDVSRVSHIPAVHNTIVDFNLKTYGRDNENLDI